MRFHARLLAGFAALVPVLVVAACVGDDPVAGSPDPSTNEGGVEGSSPVTGAATCSAGTPCAGGAPCVDGYCCDGACSGTCEACNVAGSEGKCSAATGKPVHGMCDGDATGTCAGSCDGKNRAACTYPTLACGPAASCAGGTAALAATCKGGSCPAQDSQKCALGCLEDGCLGVTQMAAGYYHACAVLTDKKVRCWGRNEEGETGQDIGTTMLPTPVEVPGLSNVVMVAATFNSTCVLFTDKTIKCFGSNASGELGNGVGSDSLTHSTPSLVTGISDATFIAGSSGGHYCAIVTGGTVKCWGSNGAGELGYGSTTAGISATPVTVCAPGSTTLPCTASSGATFVAGGDGHTCAAFAGGQVACWGGNVDGQLGFTGDNASHPFPTNVAGLTATWLTAGNQITCAASGGQAKCFGGNGGGRLGDGQDDGNKTTPTAVCTKQDCSTLLSGVTEVTTFDESSCALAGGAVRCWGSNSGSQLGDGNASASQNYAATQSIAAGAVAVASGGGAHYAIVVDRANRDIRCWGQESFNQCGDGTTSMPRSTPIAPKW
jgi:alpha-tubulin suppressor-like RCC1 family protein